jgi:tRNA-binding EMAP/Myf-like protein
VANPAEELQRIDLVVGRVVAAEVHPGSRAPSLLLTVDLGARGRRRASLLSSGYAEADLQGRQIVCALGGSDDAVVLAAHSHSAGLVLLVPDREVEEGTLVA